MHSTPDIPSSAASPEDQAYAKIQASVQRTLEQLVSETEETKKHIADQGHGRSRKTATLIAKRCVAAIENVRNTISNQYYWVISEVPDVKQPLINRLMLNAQNHLQKALQAAEDQLRTTTMLVKNPLLFDEFYPDLSKSYEKSLVIVRKYVDSYADQKYWSS
ncbi:MAG: hypothetical protein PHT15_07450 [Gallionellaceae bacterium]|nr:hypothetical protein [Gallionellaceae bacterium]